MCVPCDGLPCERWRLRVVGRGCQWSLCSRVCNTALEKAEPDETRRGGPSGPHEHTVKPRDHCCRARPMAWTVCRGRCLHFLDAAYAHEACADPSIVNLSCLAVLLYLSILSRPHPEWTL